MATLRKSNLSRSGEGFSLKFRPMGDWKQTMAVINKLPRAMTESSIKAQIKLAEEIARKAKGHLKKQDLGWPPLSETSKRTKDEMGLDGRTLIAYGTYLKSISVWRSGNRKTVMVGVKKGIYTRSYSGRRTRLEVSRIAAIHEFSSGKRVPKRPLWNPTIKEMGGARGFRDKFVVSLKAHLRRHGIPFKDLKL